MSGSLHGHSQSISRIEDEDFVPPERTPSRRGTFSKLDMDGAASAIPGPSGIRRQSGGGGASLSSSVRRTSGGLTKEGGRNRKLSDLGETY